MAERKDLVAQIGANKRRTVYLMAGFAIVITGAVVAFDLIFRFGPTFIVIAFVLALIFVWGSYFYSDRLAIAAAHAREADPQEFRQLHDIVEELCIGVGLPKPRVYVVDDRRAQQVRDRAQPHPLRDRGDDRAARDHEPHRARGGPRPRARATSATTTS